MSKSLREAGRLILVVGPSGSGKDTLLGAASRYFSNDQFIDFPTRTITRPADAGGEMHHAVDDVDFGNLVETGAFALHWQANRLHYGVPATVSAALDAGTDVVVNVSRTVLDEARNMFPGVAVISLIVSPDVLSERLTARNRESADDIRERLERALMTKPAGADVFEIDNSADLSSATTAFIRTLECLRSSGQSEALE